MIKRLRSQVVKNFAWRVYHSEAVMEWIREWQEWDRILDHEGVPPREQQGSQRASLRGAEVVAPRIKAGLAARKANGKRLGAHPAADEDTEPGTRC